MLRHRLLVAPIAVVLVACAIGPQAPSVAPSDITIPTLRPAVDFVSGENRMPEGEYLFVEYFTWNDGVSTGDASCPGGFIDFPGYEYTDDMLTVFRGIVDNGSSIGFAGHGSTNQGAMGGGTASQVVPIQELPFAFPSGGPIVHSADSDGTIVAEIAGSPFYLAPGEAWEARLETDPSPGCHATSVTRFTNFGLLPREAIDGLE